MTVIQRSISEPIRTGLDWHSTWQSYDKGLIKCWEAGRLAAENNPELAAAAKADELPITGWKGGVSRTLKKLDKFGALQYLAHWQGMRGDDLYINQEAEVIHTCSRTGMRVTFTADIAKLAEQGTDDTAEEREGNGGSSRGVQEQPLFP